MELLAESPGMAVLAGSSILNLSHFTGHSGAPDLLTSGIYLQSDQLGHYVVVFSDLIRGCGRDCQSPFSMRASFITPLPLPPMFNFNLGRSDTIGVAKSAPHLRIAA